ncbi:MAG: NAD(P)H-dependent oxidoreductase [Sediminibacterium sp.]|nr:NAD(P)H-dependent oxidoreductase [Sediminibacterium sp.]
MEKITVLSCTNRNDSMTRRVSLYYLNALKKEGVDVQLLDFTILPRDIAFSEVFGQRSESFTQLINTYVTGVHKFLFVTPEYNGSFPGILKVFLDSVHPKEWTDKKACLTGVSEGRAGNLRGLDHLNGVLQYLKINVYHNKLPVSVVSKIISPELELLNPDTETVIQNQIKGFIKF